MKKLLSILFIASLAAACSKDDNPPAWDDKTGACLKNYDFQYEKLLTKADVGKHVTIDEASYKLDVSTMKGQYGHATYTWNSDRPDLEIEILGQIIRGPDRNRLEFTQLYFYTASEVQLYSQESVIELFDIGYRKLSDAEVREMRENLDRQYADDPAGLEQAKKFLEARLSFNYQRVEVGDRAYWSWNDTHGLELNVLAGATSFSLRTKFSAEAATTLPITVALAKEILAKCN
ncbi:hypothetical protein [Parapedobacter sp. 10938]|uniref:hypothetical protein n=1 Tax=Parapedobacter flavus TaxID=3110225 RepID=UPI002DBD2ED7|nr:hypothetical protein [Parapedobacter sp. 10938]MEC3879189.1 hypothetical protein [Parapedobacter sp. 10938]